MTSEVEGLDLDALEKAARAALEDGDAGPHRIDDLKYFITTFDPPTVLRLLAALRAQADRVRVLEGANERLSRLGRAVERERDDALARAEAAERRAGELEVALSDVCNPLGKITRDAKAAGRQLSGQAYSIANSLAFVQGIARTALLPATQAENPQEHDDE